MKNIADQLEEIKKQTEADKDKFDQLSSFEETINNLQKVFALKKPTYSLPQVDTIGKQTYISLNKK